jgi:hypothetical protein
MINFRAKASVFLGTICLVPLIGFASPAGAIESAAGKGSGQRQRFVAPTKVRSRSRTDSDDSLCHCLALSAATLRPTPAALAPSATLGKYAGFALVCPRGNLALATI